MSFSPQRLFCFYRYVFRSWGRIGTTIGGNKLETFHSATDAIHQFRYLYEDKTGNSWDNRKNFDKKANKFFPLELDYGEVRIFWNNHLDEKILSYAPRFFSHSNLYNQQAMDISLC